MRRCGSAIVCMKFCLRRMSFSVEVGDLGVNC
jgi:hypothetical protein